MDTFLRNVNNEIINPLIIFLFVLALVFFLWGVMEMMMNLDNEEKRKTGQNHMFWGVIGIAIMISVWGLINLVLQTFDIKDVKIDENAGTYEIDLK